MSHSSSTDITFCRPTLHHYRRLSCPRPPAALSLTHTTHNAINDITLPSKKPRPLPRPLPQNLLPNLLIPILGILPLLLHRLHHSLPQLGFLPVPRSGYRALRRVVVFGRAGVGGGILLLSSCVVVEIPLLLSQRNFDSGGKAFVHCNTLLTLPHSPDNLVDGELLAINVARKRLRLLNAHSEPLQTSRDTAHASSGSDNVVADACRHALDEEQDGRLFVLHGGGGLVVAVSGTAVAGLHLADGGVRVGAVLEKEDGELGEADAAGLAFELLRGRRLCVPVSRWVVLFSPRCCCWRRRASLLGHLGGHGLEQCVPSRSPGRLGRLLVVWISAVFEECACHFDRYGSEVGCCCVLSTRDESKREDSSA
ncbi:hypothetical protein BKA80DRAFT_281256, partial [Phyllosticta citrichinensis]